MSTAEKYPYANVAAAAGARLGREYRPARVAFWVGLGCTVAFLAAGVGSVWVALANPDGSFARPVTTAIGFGVFWGLLTLLSASILWSAVVERVVLWEDRVRVVGLRRTREVRFADVTRAEWAFRPATGEAVVLHAPGGPVTVSFSLFEPPNREGVKDFLRCSIPASLQSGHEQAARREMKWVAALIGLCSVALIGLAFLMEDDPVERWFLVAVGAVGCVVAFFAALAVPRVQ